MPSYSQNIKILIDMILVKISSDSDLISKVIDVTSSETIQQLLVGEDSCKRIGVLVNVLPILREKLTKDKWKDYPVHKQAFVWCIKQIKVSMVLPKSLSYCIRIVVTPFTPLVLQHFA